MESSWWGQIGLGAGSAGMLALLFRQYVNYVGRRITEDRAQHTAELERLAKIQEARLTDQKEVAQAWRDTAQSLQKTNAQQADQLDRVVPAVETAVRLLETIRSEGHR